MSTVAATLTKPYGPRDAGAIMTLDEFEEAEFEPGFRYELIHGVLVVTPPPLEEERDANEELGYLLRDYQKRRPQGKALNLTLPEQNVRTIGQNRRCDRVLWAGLARRPRSRGAVGRRDVPTIVVEFPSSRLALGALVRRSRTAAARASFGGPTPSPCASTWRSTWPIGMPRSFGRSKKPCLLAASLRRGRIFPRFQPDRAAPTLLRPW